MSLTIRFALFTSLLCLLIIGGISYFSYRLSFNDMEDRIGRRLEAVVSSGALQLDGGLHDSIRGPEDAESEAFIEMRDYLRELKVANSLNEELYTFRREGEEVVFIVMTHGKPFIGDTYTIRPEMLPTLNDGKPNHTGVYGDKHGEWISAYAPIFDSEGHVSGLLEADIRFEEFRSLLLGEYMSLLIIYVIFALVAVVLSFLLAKQVTRKLNYLTDITEKISLGRVDTPIEMSGSDEVSKLGASLERMRESLKIASQLMD